jgi:hypothetical protein
LARVLLEQKLVPARGPIPSVTVAQAAVETGLTVEQIGQLARTLAARKPALAIARDHSPAIAALNVILGAVGTRGGIVRRSQESQRHESADAEISKARAILIDASVPWDFTPHTDAEIFRFAVWDGGASKAAWLLPAPGFLEELSDVPSAPTHSVETYAVAPSLAKASAEVQSAAQFLATLDPTLSPVDKIIHARCETLFRKRSGTVYGQESTVLASFASVQKFEEQLAKGAVWVGEPSPPGGLRCELKEWPTDIAAVSEETWATEWPVPVLPPLAAKLYVESSLRDAPIRRNA